MGSEDKQGNESPAHTVHLTAFRLQGRPVTVEELARFRGTTTGKNEKRLPATEVSWYEAYLYAAWLGGRLPTEAEWEYACRARTKTAYWSGDTEKDLAEVAWYYGNAKAVRPVGQKPANRWGLHDMHGNVWEWAADWYGSYQDGEQHDPWGPLATHGGGYRVLRGGGWGYPADDCRSAYRGGDWPGDRGGDFGFRVRLPAPEPD
jgi:formylglycine-generating enzyme required for sulfatase activity